MVPVTGDNVTIDPDCGCEGECAYCQEHGCTACYTEWVKGIDEDIRQAQADIAAGRLVSAQEMFDIMEARRRAES